MWSLTFISYMSYHMVRSLPAVVAGTLDPTVKFDPWCNPINPSEGWSPFSAVYNLPISAHVYRRRRCVVHGQRLWHAQDRHHIHRHA